MAEFNAVLAGLTDEELAEFKVLGPTGHLGRHMVAALDLAAGGQDARRGSYVMDGTVNGNGASSIFSAVKRRVRG